MSILENIKKPENKAKVEVLMEVLKLPADKENGTVKTKDITDLYERICQEVEQDEAE